MYVMQNELNPPTLKLVEETIAREQFELLLLTMEIIFRVYL